jgi:hypothetical protein
LPPFKEVRAIQKEIKDRALDLQFKGEVWAFRNHDRDTGVASVYIHARSSESWIRAQVDELSGLFQKACVAQAVGIVVTLYYEGADSKEESAIKLLIHLPITEMILIFIMVVMFVKMARQWRSMKANFRDDAWTW